MYVSQDMRGNGLGRLLMLELIRKAKDCDGLEQINLTVVSNKESAKQLYRSVGFEIYGVERNALKYNGQYFDEDFMYCHYKSILKRARICGNLTASLALL